MDEEKDLEKAEAALEDMESEFEAFENGEFDDNAPPAEDDVEAEESEEDSSIEGGSDEDEEANEEANKETASEEPAAEPEPEETRTEPEIKEEAAPSKADAETKGEIALTEPPEGGGAKKEISLGEAAYLCERMERMTDRINTVTLAISEAAASIKRINSSLASQAQRFENMEMVLDDKISAFQEGTETWGADMNAVAGNVRKACEESRKFLNDEMKRGLEHTQEQMVKSSVDKLFVGTEKVMDDAQEQYDNLIKQVVANYRQFCKAAKQHQKGLETGYFKEVTEMKKWLYVVLAIQIILFVIVGFVLLKGGSV